MLGSKEHLGILQAESYHSEMDAKEERGSISTNMVICYGLLYQRYQYNTSLHLRQGLTDLKRV
jgi:hypothetical protein